MASAACDPPQRERPVTGESARAPVAVEAPLRAPDPAAQPHAALSCEAERKRLLQLPGLPGAPKFEAARALIFGHAKAEPVLFVKAPEYAPSSDVAVRRYRRSIERASYPWDVVRSIVPRFLDHPEHGRQVLLRDGYLYAETPELAFALVDHVRAQHLFASEHIFIQRGELTLSAARGSDGKYRYTNGPEAGKTVRLLLLDRVGAGTPPPALLGDVGGVALAFLFVGGGVFHLWVGHFVDYVLLGN